MCIEVVEEEDGRWRIVASEEMGQMGGLVQTVPKTDKGAISVSGLKAALKNKLHIDDHDVGHSCLLLLVVAFFVDAEGIWSFDFRQLLIGLSGIEQKCFIRLDR